MIVSAKIKDDPCLYITECESLQDIFPLLNGRGDIICVKESPIIEIYGPVNVGCSFVVTFTTPGKKMKYKIVLWAEDISHATARVSEIIAQGYDMAANGIRQQDIFVL